MSRKLLVTGASGFIGSFIVERGLELGFEVWAGVRDGSSRKWLQHPGIHFIHLDLGNREALTSSLRSFKETEGVWDYVVHAAGATKARNEAAFRAVNFEGTRLLASLLVELKMIPQRFLFMSSLSVMGELHADPRSERGADGCRYDALKGTDAPCPNTAYGRSKLEAEQYLRSIPNFPLIVLRPTGVYGPREKDYFLMARSIASHVDFSVGYRPQEITFIYVSDLVDAVYLTLEHGSSGSTYLLSDGETYQSATFSDLLQKEMGVSHVIHIKAPLAVLKLVCGVSQLISQITGKPSTLNLDKYRILKQRNWRCDITPATELGYQPKFNLERGVKVTVAWYKSQGWI